MNNYLYLQFYFMKGKIVIFLILAVIQIQSHEGHPKITEKVFFDISINNKYTGRLVLGMYGEIVPKTVQNFVILSGETSHWK